MISLKDVKTVKHDLIELERLRGVGRIYVAALSAYSELFNTLMNQHGVGRLLFNTSTKLTFGKGKGKLTSLWC